MTLALDNPNPCLQDADEAQRQTWQISGGGYGLHWPDIDDYLSTAGLLRGAPAPGGSGKNRVVLHEALNEKFVSHS